MTRAALSSRMLSGSSTLGLSTLDAWPVIADSENFNAVLNGATTQFTATIFPEFHGHLRRLG
jgi:hypothetical protein